MIYSLRYREQLPIGVRDEFEGLASGITAAFETEHDVNGDGEHTDITVNSISAKPGEPVIPLGSGLRMLTGPIFLDLLGNATHVAGLRPPSISTSQNDYAPGGLDEAIMLEVESSSAINITGLQVTGRQKRFLYFGNRGNYTITLTHNDILSLEGNRFGFVDGEDLSVPSASYILLYYDVGSEVWRLVGGSSEVTIVPGSYSSVKSVQRGSLTIASGQSTGDTSISTVNSGKASVRLLGAIGDLTNGFAITGLTTNDVDAARGNTSGTTAVVYFEVWEEF